MTILPVLLLLIHYQMASAITDINTDKLALLAFKSHLQLDPSHALFTNWSDYTPVCYWVGVTCSSRPHRVAALNISTMGLTGNLEFPPLRNLTFLDSLDLSSNHFQGAMTPWLGDMCRDLPRLEELYLDHNMLYGHIPSNISECSQLRILHLSSNQLEGRLPREIGNLRLLETLYLGYNNITGEIPEELGNLTILNGLAMTNNKLSGFIPTWLYKCAALSFLELSENKLIGSIPPNIGNSTLLRNLGLTGSRLTGEIPQEIGGLNALEGLYLSGNMLRGSIPQSLFNISTLGILSLLDNQLSGNLPSDLGYKLPNLERLLLSGNIFTAVSSELSFLASLTNCRQLRILGLSDIPFHGVLPASIGNLSASVQYILAQNCNFRGRIPAEIGNLTSLIWLDLCGNQFAAGLFPPSLGGLHSLQMLYLSRNRVSGAIPSTVCELSSLNELWLNDNQISGAIPYCLGNITTLSVLKLNSNKLNSHIPASLWNLRDLHELNLSSNSLIGSLAPQMKNMRAVMNIDLSFNKLSGVIPSEIGDLKTLTLLQLAHNELLGSIPESMGSMISLKTLDLSHNDLSGVVPVSLEKLKDLTSFNVSFNGLDGEIPSEGPFRNFTFESFMSNKDLCGDPKYRVQMCQSRSTSSKVHKPNKQLQALLISLGIFSVLFVAISTYIVVRRNRRRDQTTIIPERIVHFWSRQQRQRVSYNELFEATDGYNESNLLGTGGFGSVYKAMLKNGKLVAVKVFNLQLEIAFKSFKLECEILRNIRHRNICKVINCCSNQNFKALLLEYKPHGSLEKWLYSQNCFLDVFQRIDIMIDVACALEYLHHGYSVPVIHCDLKPSNILLDENMTAQVCDFGIAKILGDGESTVQTMTLATLGYVAPEYGTGGFVSVKCDVYSYGIVLIEVFTTKRPNDEIFKGDLSLRSLVEDSMANDVIDPNLVRSDNDEYMDCLSSILELGLMCSVESPNERMSIKDVIAALQRIKLRLHGI